MTSDVAPGHAAPSHAAPGLAAPGLRERKRLATRRAIQLAVLDLVGDRGLDRVTVDEISRVADVSPRTFFNYFATKEAALVGDGPTLPAAESIARFIHAPAGETLAAGLGALLGDSTHSTTLDHEMTYRRRTILRDYPQLFALRMATMKSFEADLAEVVAQRLVVDDAALASTPDLLESRARLVALVAFAAMRHAWTTWADEENIVELGARIRASFAELESVLAGS